MSILKNLFGNPGEIASIHDDNFDHVITGIDALIEPVKVLTIIDILRGYGGVQSKVVSDTNSMSVVRKAPIMFPFMKDSSFQIGDRCVIIHCFGVFGASKGFCREISGSDTLLQTDASHRFWLCQKSFFYFLFEISNRFDMCGVNKDYFGFEIIHRFHFG